MKFLKQNNTSVQFTCMFIDLYMFVKPKNIPTVIINIPQ